MARKRALRKNPAFLVALVPYIPYIAAGVGGLVAVNYAASTASSARDAATQWVGPTLGGGGGYLLARTRKLDIPYQVVSTVMGVGAGLVAQNMYNRFAAKQAVAQEAAAEKKWCDDSPVLSWFAPSCY
jgi:hypothetical protein